MAKILTLFVAIIFITDIKAQQIRRFKCEDICIGDSIVQECSFLTDFAILYEIKTPQVDSSGAIIICSPCDGVNASRIDIQPHYGITRTLLKND